MTDNTAPANGANQNGPRTALGVTVEQITAAYAKAEPAATPQQVESVLWLFRHAKARGVRGNEGVGKLFTPPRDPSAISKLWSGTYGANLDNICADIDTLRNRVAQEIEVDGDRMVRLPWLTNEVHNFSNLVHATRTIGMIFGPNQNGKTEAVKAHVAEVGSTRRVIYVEMPDGAIRTEFLDRCLEAVSLSPKRANDEKKKAFKGQLNPQTELIIDEFHQCWEHGILRSQVVEMVRRFRDETGCSLLLVSTNIDAYTDKKFGGVMQQISNRGVLRLRIPDRPKRIDVDAICEAYHLRPAAKDSEAGDIVDAICEESGLGKLCKYLQIARHLANAKKQVLAWDHFVTAHRNILGWAGEDAKGKEGR